MSLSSSSYRGGSQGLGLSSVTRPPGQSQVRAGLAPSPSGPSVHCRDAARSFPQDSAGWGLWTTRCSPGAMSPGWLPQATSHSPAPWPPWAIQEATPHLGQVAQILRSVRWPAAQEQGEHFPRPLVGAQGEVRRCGWGPPGGPGPTREGCEESTYTTARLPQDSGFFQ